MTLKSDPKYGLGNHDVEAIDSELSAEQLAEQIRKLFASPRYQAPTLPKVALQLLELSRQPNVEFAQVISVLEQDPLLAGMVMVRVQSPIYAARTPIRTLKEAVVRLGLGTVRDLVLEVATNLKVFRSTAYAEPMERLRRHSLASAHLSRLVCRYTSVDAEYAFLCGLLHDIGVGATLILLGENREVRRPSMEWLWPALEETHEASSGLVAQLWKLPPEVALVIGNHHHPKLGGYPHPMIAALRVAEFLAQEIGAGLVPPNDSFVGSTIEPTTPSELEAARKVLSLGDPQFEALRKELPAVEELVAKSSG